MTRVFVLCLIVAPCCAFGRAAEPKECTRPITEAESVLAVYRQDWRLASSGRPAIIFVAWPDGHVVWSRDRLNGGKPYLAGRVDPKAVAGLLSSFEKAGLFADDKLNEAHFGPDSQFITVLIKSGKLKVRMQSWHELFEASDDIVVDHQGAELLGGRRRLEELRKAPADYVFLRTVWSETRAKLGAIVPDNGVPTTGSPSMKAGVLSWLHDASSVKPNDFGERPKK